MTTRIGINGFGRMGRLVVRALRHHPELELAHVNEPKGGIAAAAHLPLPAFDDNKWVGGMMTIALAFGVLLPIAVDHHCLPPPP